MFNLFGGCCILLIICLLLFKKNIISPAILMVFGFTLSSFFLIFYSYRWNFQGESVSIFIITSLICFVIGATLICAITRLTGKRNISKKIYYIKISKWKCLIYLLFQLFVYLCIMIYIFKHVGMPASLNDISKSIGLYYDLNRLGEIQGIPGLLNIFKILNVSGIYLLSYILINNYFYCNKIDLYVLANVVVGVLGSLLTGVKTECFMYIISILVLYVFFNIKRSGTLKVFKARNILLIILIIIGGLFMFNILSILQGRTVAGMNSNDVLATYLAAPIKNLEIFMTTHNRISTIWGGETFLDTYNWLYDLTKNCLYYVPSFYEYQWINGNGLGNVYTLLMPLYNDFGLVGTYCVMILLGMFSQFIFEKSIFKEKDSKINYFMIFYSYLSYAIFFSFFSNKFFEMIFSRAGIYFIIGLFIWKWLLVDRLEGQNGN